MVRDFNLDSSLRIFLRYDYILVKDVYIPEDYYSKKPRGFAFVEFFDIKEARWAHINVMLCL